MNTRTTIDLRDAGVFQVKAIGLSYDNNVWVYDEVENKLKKISEEGRLISETPDLRQAISEAISPQHIIDAEGMVYLYDSLKGLYAFDYYGTLKKKYFIPNWQSLRVIKKSILGVLNDSIYRYDMDTFVSRQHKLPASISNARKIYFTGERIYALKNDALEIYTVK